MSTTLIKNLDREINRVSGVLVSLKAAREAHARVFGSNGAAEVSAPAPVPVAASVAPSAPTPSKPARRKGRRARKAAVAAAPVAAVTVSPEMQASAYAAATDAINSNKGKGMRIGKLTKLVNPRLAHPVLPETLAGLLKTSAAFKTIGKGVWVLAH